MTKKIFFVLLVVLLLVAAVTAQVSTFDEELESDSLASTFATEMTDLLDDAEIAADAESESSNFDCGMAYVTGKATGSVQCTTINGKAVTTGTAAAFNTMKAAAAKAGITLTLNSGFRTMAEQQRLYNCYVTKKCNNGNLAAKPGYSNHQNGKAVDISTGGGAFAWLSKNGSKYGFVRTVPSENWHWELRPGTRCNAFVSYSCNQGLPSSTHTWA